MKTTSRIFTFVALGLLAVVMACTCSSTYYGSFVSIIATQQPPDPVETCLYGLTVFSPASIDPAVALEVCRRNSEVYLCPGITEDMNAEQILAQCNPPPQTSGMASGPSSPPQSDCSLFRLTSPLDGLPNGAATFYWDPLPDAVSYVINVYADGALASSLGAPAGANSTSGDMSQSAIGGNYTFFIEAIAVMPDGTTCVSSASVNRESNLQEGDGSGGDGRPREDDDDDSRGDGGGGGYCAPSDPPVC